MISPECSSLIHALDLISCPAIWLDRNGTVLAVSQRASAHFDGEFSVRGRRLYVTDSQARARLDELIDRFRLEFEKRVPTASLIVVNRSNHRPIVLRAILKGSESPCEAGILLVLTDLDEMPVISQASLMAVFSLTPVQAQLASLLVQGKSLKEIATQLHISSGTARNHLKAVFVRTATRRQSELVLLLSRIR
ncbi:helix-turn-helix transcriptional regulator [Bradyrhizobium sp. B120]|uniref:helix-turn-helix transcriptional regulator n=1 Tax=Bradyrhizobium sp. B120 TaxID=3410088 RepID=UPI003B984673